LVALRDPQKQVEAAKHIVQHGMSVRAAETYVADLHNPSRLAASPTKPKVQQPSALPVSRADDQALEQELESLLGGMRVQLMRTAESDKRGRLVIHFDNEEMLQTILERLGTQ
jgi:ParB-like chromosome segregation protein Spo0J